ncbi:indolepyruvate oxidoreductase subunit beta family protein [Betaproteobacteria bacterium LSUCC0117]|jgi:indolepyruvate ferredoxin oxidoreductase beta subunit|nr:indolepyruvate oxidoreductase subunit beta family protein [Betaproteobacteria bacterium LSUCC0117]
MRQIPIKRVLIAALGGEGGGVLAGWLVRCARESGRAVQATSVPGVAQRTGATSYYLEWTAEPVDNSDAPTFAMSPVPACVDVVVASESLEAARMLERGFVTPDLTCLIASTSRVYTTAEKMHMVDGRLDDSLIHTLTQTLAREAILMDMESIRKAHQTAISAVLFGAMSGASVLPWSVEACEAVITASGKGVAASLAGFHAARQRALDAKNAVAVEQPVSPTQLKLAEVCTLGEARCLDYQDAAYATEYRDLVSQACASQGMSDELTAAWTEGARHLALWMCYEDLIRVADLKTKPERIARIRAEAQARDGQLVRVTEHFKPGIEEIASVLPQRLGRLLIQKTSERQKKKFQFGLHVRSTSLWGYLMLRGLARMRPLRRRSLRYHEEATARHAWWEAMRELAPKSPTFGLALASLPQVLKGYGDTQKRGRENYDRLWRTCVEPALTAPEGLDAAGKHLAEAIKATLSNPDAHVAPSPQSQPIRWFKQVPN